MILNPVYFNNRQKNNKLKNLSFVRNRIYEHEVTASDKAKAALGAIIGTAVPMLYMMKKRKISNPLKMNYGLGDMVILSGSSVIGGVGISMIAETKEANKNKLKEGTFQFLNAAIPTWIVGGMLKLCETSKKCNNIPGKIASIAVGLLVGMFGTAEISNLIFDPHDKLPDRKLTLTDCIANADDAIGVLTLAKIPLVSHLHLEKLLPLIYGYCGYRAGKSN